VERDEVAIVEENPHLNGHEKEDHTSKYKTMLSDVKGIEQPGSPGPQVEDEAEKKASQVNIRI